MSTRPVVYTALMGGYEQLNEQPQATRSELDFVCFTDDPSLRSDSWQIEVVEPALPLDPVRSARRIKILGEPLGDVAETLWIDNSVVLTVPPEELLGDWLADADLVVPVHSFRKHLHEEFAAVLEEGLDDPARVHEQLNHYVELIPEVLEQPPLWTAILARRRTDLVTRFGTRWFEHVLRYSRRDQLSAPAAVAAVPALRITRLEIDNYATEWHRWPVTENRRRHDPPRDPLRALGPLSDRVHELEEELKGVRVDLAASSTELAAAREAIGALITSVSSREQARAELQAHADGLQAELEAVRASATWRAGTAALGPFRPVTRMVRRLRDH